MRGSRIGWGVIVAACVVAGPAGATHHKTTHARPAHHETSHHTASTHHGTSSHRGTSSHHGKDKRHASPARHEDRKPAAAAGATSVPAGGIKLFCGPGKSPLMVRKMTQGAGTSVTVICR